MLIWRKIIIPYGKSCDSSHEGPVFGRRTYKMQSELSGTRILVLCLLPVLPGSYIALCFRAWHSVQVPTILNYSICVVNCSPLRALLKVHLLSEAFLLSSLHRERMDHYFLCHSTGIWSQMIIGATVHIYNFISVLWNGKHTKLLFGYF